MKEIQQREIIALRLPARQAANGPLQTRMADDQQTAKAGCSPLQRLRDLAADAATVRQLADLQLQADRGASRPPVVQLNDLAPTIEPDQREEVVKAGNENRILDSVMKHLSAEDLARLSMVDKRSNERVGPVVPQVLAQEMFQPPSEAAKARPLEQSTNVDHIHATGDRDRDRAKIDFLTAKKQIATRALREDDAANIEQGEPLKPKGSGVDIASQVAGNDTGLLSASEKPMHKFSEGSSGHAALKRPEHYEEKTTLNRMFPQTVAPPKPSVTGISNHKKKFLSHDAVMKGVGASSDNDQRNAREAHEVMFAGPLGLEHVVVMDGGLPSGQHELSKAAVTRREEHEAKAAAEAKDRTGAWMKWIKRATKDSGLQNTLYDTMPEAERTNRKKAESWIKKQLQ